MFNESLTAHTQAVEHLAAAGITPPAEWLALRERWHTAANGHEDTALSRYTNAIVTGDTDADLPLLHALALAATAADNVSRATVRNAVGAAVFTALRRIYAEVAVPNYKTAAQRFDNTAATFTKTAAIVDPEAEAADMVSGDDRTRKAWTDALLAARELDALLPTLQAAAKLAGVTAETAEATLALTVNTEGLHRRQVWQAWDSTGRCGRWSAIVALGATIAAADLDNFTPYRKPKPIEEHWQQVGRGQQQRYTVDPEDAEYQAAQPV